MYKNFLLHSPGLNDALVQDACKAGKTARISVALAAYYDPLRNKMEDKKLVILRTMDSQAYKELCPPKRFLGPCLLPASLLRRRG